MIKFIVSIMALYDMWEDKCAAMYGNDARFACSICLGFLTFIMLALLLFIVIGLIAFIFE